MKIDVDTWFMPVNLIDLFKIWNSPSSAHFTGSMMRAGRAFAVQLQEVGLFNTVTRVEILVYGSSSVTGRVQGTDRALMLGLAGYEFEDLDVWQMNAFMQRVEQNGALHLLGQCRVPFSPLLHIAFPKHPAPPQSSTRVRFRAHDRSENLLLEVEHNRSTEGSSGRTTS